MAGVQTQLQKISCDTTEQIEKLQQKLDQEMNKRVTIENELHSYKLKVTNLDTELTTSIDENKSLKENIKKLQQNCTDLTKLEDELAKTREELDKAQSNQENQIIQLTDDLKTEKLNVSKCKKEIRTLNSELKLNAEKIETISKEIKVNEKSYEREVLELQHQIKDLIKQKEDLENRYQEVQESDEINRSKVSDLERLVARLEQGVARLEASDNQEDQITKLELQLKGLHEAVAVEKEKTRNAKTALWRKEKEISDLNLDKRILTRELKTSEEAVTSLSKQIDELSKVNKISSESSDQKIETLQEQINEKVLENDRLKLELTKVQSRFDLEKLEWRAKVEALDKRISALKKVEMEIDCLRNEKRDIERQFNSAQVQLERLVIEKQSLRGTYEKSHLEINKYQGLLETRNREFKQLEMVRIKHL